MKKPPAIILLITCLILFNLLYQVGFDLSTFETLKDNPLKSIQMILPFFLIIGLLTRQAWAWYFITIISGFRVLSSLSLFIFSLPNTDLDIVYLFSYHGIILWLLFHQDVSAFFSFETSTIDQRIKHIIGYTLILTVIMIPVVWLTLAFNR